MFHFVSHPVQNLVSLSFIKQKKCIASKAHIYVFVLIINRSQPWLLYNGINIVFFLIYIYIYAFIYYLKCDLKKIIRKTFFFVYFQVNKKENYLSHLFKRSEQDWIWKRTIWELFKKKRNKKIQMEVTF